MAPMAPVSDKQKLGKRKGEEGLEAARGERTIGSTEEAASISAPSRRIGERSRVPAADHLTASAGPARHGPADRRRHV